MKINNKLKTAAVLAVLIFAVPNSYAENVNTFEQLKEKVSSSSGDIIQVEDISDFSDTLTVPTEGGHDVHIQSGKSDGNAKFSPQASLPSTNKRAFDNNGVLNLDKVDLDGFDVQSGESDKNGGAVKNGTTGRLTLNGAGLKNNKAENGGAVYNDTNSQLTVKGAASFSDNKATTNGGAVYNKGKLTITSDNTGNVTFENNTATTAGADLYQESGSTEINGSEGSVTFKGGIAGNGTITHIGDGSLLLDGDNSKYQGKFENSKGTVTVGESAKFFAKESDIKGGKLEYKSSSDLEEGASLKFGDIEGNGGSLVLGTGSNSSKLTVKGDSSIAGASSVELQSGSTLDIQKKDSFSGAMTGGGTLSLGSKDAGAGLTFKNGASVSDVNFKSEGGEVTFDNAENVDSLISGLFGETSQASKVDILFKDDEITEDLEVEGESGKINSVTFQGTDTYDGTLTNSGTGTVTVEKEANLTLGGTVENSSDFNVKGNLKGAGSVNNNSGTVTLEGDASGFTGSYTQSEGKTDVKENSKFFGGTSTVTGGELNWETSNDLTGTLQMEGGNLTVGSESVPSTGAKLTIKDGSSIDGVESVTVNSNSTLGLETDTTITGTLSGEGTLNLKGATLTFDGSSAELTSADSLKFKSENNSTVLVKDTSSAGDFVGLTAGENAENQGLTLQLQNAAGNVDIDLNIDGTSLKELDFLEGTNQYNASGKKIKVSGEGVLNNQGTTTITGDIENTNTTSEGIVNSSELTVSGTLNNSGKLQNTGRLTVDTLNADSGSDINNANGTLKVTGAAENDDKITGGILEFNSLTNNGGGNISDAESITVTEKVTNIGEIEGQQMSFGSLDNQGSLTSSSTLTITGNAVSGDKALKNSNEGIISAAAIAVTGDIENSGDSITATTGDITAVDISNTSGTIAATAGAITASGNITNGGESITAGGTISAVGITNSNGTIEAAVINATGNIENSGTSITAITGDITAVDISNTSGTIAATTGAITTSGSITNEGDSITASGNITAVGDITNSGTSLTAGGTLSAANITNESGSITAALIEAVEDINNSGDDITSEGDITASNITNSNGTIESTNGNVEASGNIENTDGSIKAKQKLSAEGSVTNSGEGTLQGGEIELGSVASNEGTIESTTGGITINDGITSNTGSVTANGKLTVSGDVSNTGEGSLQGSEIELGSVASNEGTIESTEGGITVNGDLSNAGTITSASDLTVKGVLTNDKDITVEGTLTATEGKLTNNTEGVIDIKGGSLADVDNEGNITNDGDLSVSGTITGSSGTITHNGGELTLSGDASGYTGTFNLDGGTLNVEESGTLFGGETKINNGAELDITSSGPIDFTGVLLGDNGIFNYTSTGENESTIDNAVLSFEGTNATATFAGENETYTLADGFQGDENNLIFKDTKLKLEGTDYQEAGAITLEDSTLDLHEDEYSTDDYYFKKFTSKNGKVDLDVQIQKAEDEDKTAYLETDRLHFDEESTGSLSIGKLHIANEDNSENGLDITTAVGKDILDGENVSFGESTVGQTLYKATTSFTYDVEVSDKTLKLKKTGVTDADTLQDMNIREGKREFSYKGTYHSNEDLGSTADGTFLVYGETEDGSDVLSGIKEGTEDEKVSFFDIGEDKTTHLEISDLTIEDTESEKGGSVARNESENSSVIVTGSTIQNNASTGGKGGAFYNNGGRDIDFETEEDIDGVGLAIQESTLKGNKSVDGIGGAIYNDENGSMYLADVIVEAGTDDASNDIYNAGNAFVKSDDSLLVGGNLFQSKFTNKGNIIFKGKNTISDYVNNGGTTKFNGSTYLDDVSGDSGTITNSLEVTLRGDASNYQGEYVQKQAEAGKQSITQVEEGAKFFGGTTTIEDGILNWFTNEESDYTLKVEKGIVNIGDGEDETGTLNLTTGSSIAEGVETNIYKDSELGIMGSDVEVTLGENSTWEGNVNLEEGTLNIDGITNATIDPQGNIKDILGSVTASGGNLNLQNGSVLAVDEKSNVDENVILNIDKDSAAGVFGGGSLTVSDGDTWAGDLYMDKNATGELTIKDYTGSNGLLEANGGRLTITGTSDITLQSQGSGEEIENSFIAKEVQTTIDGDATVHVKNGGELTLDNATNDTWAGTVDLREGGTFNYGMTDITGTLTAEGGNLNLLEGSILTIKEPSVVEEAVAVDIQKGSVVKIEDGADFTIDSETNDKWNGTIQILKDGAATEGGSLITEGIDNTVSGYGGGLQQNTGSSTFDLKSNIHISDASSYITGGDVNIKGESQLSFGAGVQDLSVDKLNMEDNTKLGIMNGEINYAQAEQVNVEGTANFAVDLNPRSHIGDQFEFGSITGSSGDAELNISDFNFQGGAPIDRYIYFELFTGDKNSVDFTATKDLKFTPIGYYGLQSMGEGMYRAYLDHYNPQVFRGQVATIGMYTNQLMTDDIVTNHFVLHNERLIDSAKNANKYSAVSPLFQPYQQTYEDGGLWNKSYASFNRLNLTQGLNVGNNVYGTLLGADLPAIELKNNWKLIPTGYVGYNGGHQYYSGVSSYQNGGQLGVMGTFLKDNFVGSVTAYGGGYMNDMDVAGHNDSTANWFAGAATKAAYNVKLSETFTFQPNIFAAYNGFGRQKWHTDFGDMTMHSGMLNGANVAPGANFIFDKKTWSLYASVQYMFFINDRVNGGAGNVNLPNVRMHHGYLQYGLGGTKVWKDRLAAYGQFNILNAGITGIGVQAGMHYKFDLHLPFTKKEYSNGEKKYIKKL